MTTAPSFELSRKQHERARDSLAGGVATAFRANQLPLPITFERGSAARIWDIDGNEYVDYALAFGPLILGHSPEPVLAVGGALVFFPARLTGLLDSSLRTGAGLLGG